MIKKTGQLAPIVLFVYNRPEHTARTLDALAKNELADQSVLYIYSDTARDAKQVEKVAKVRKIIRRACGFKEIHIIEATSNKGLACSVINGVSEVINRHEKVIVLEDDLITSRSFLRFMNDALDFYRLDRRVWSISGYQYPFDIPTDYKKSVYLSYRASSWGWATWKDRWDTVDWEVHDYREYRSNPFLIAHFCKGGTDLDKMLRYQQSGRINSWAIRWCYSQSMQRRYTLYPTCSLVSNIGVDGSGTHCDSSASRFNVKLVKDFDYLLESELAPHREIMRRFRRIVNRSIIRKIKRIFFKQT